MSDVEIVARVERRRKWTIEEKAALIAEVESEGGKVKLVARRHRVSESLLYNWRSAWKAAASAAIGASGAVTFVPLGVVDEASREASTALPPPKPPQILRQIRCSVSPQAELASLSGDSRHPALRPPDG